MVGVLPEQGGQGPLDQQHPLDRQRAVDRQRDVDPVLATAEALTAVAEDLAGEFSLLPLLERILRRCAELLGCDAGSVCSVDEAAGTYRKEADIGVSCQSGQVFPLSEGMTGAVVAHRGPLWFDRYDDVQGGHVLPADRATLRGVIGVPLIWRGAIVGVCVVFSRDPDRVFGPADAQLLQLFAKHAAVALANARTYEAAEEQARAQARAAERQRLLREVHDSLTQGLVGVVGELDGLLVRLDDRDGELRAAVRHARSAAEAALVEVRRTLVGMASSPLADRGIDEVLASEIDWVRGIGHVDARLVVAGQPATVEPKVAHELVRIAQEALTNIVRHAQAHTVRVGLVYEPVGVSLLIQDDGSGFDAQASRPSFGLRSMTEGARAVGGQVSVESVPGWGTSVRARFPYVRPAASRVGERLRVLVVDEQPLLRAGIARLLSFAEPGIEIGAEAAPADAVAVQRTVQAHVAVVGLHARERHGDLAEQADGTSGLVVCRALCAEHPALAVVGLVTGTPGSGSGLAATGAQALAAAALRAGACGCLDDEVDGATLAQAVIAAGRGQAVLSGTALRHLYRELDGVTDPGPALTEREREVRALLEEGLPDKLIAQRLLISVKTVEKHVGSLLRKTGARNRTELAGLGWRTAGW